MEASATAPPTKTHYRQELDRALKLFSNVTLTLGTVGPTASVFAFVPVVLLVAGSFGFIVFLLAAVFALCQGLCYAELGTAYPIAGGEYSMVARVLGRPVGAVLFALMVTNYVFVPSAYALGAGTYLGVVWPWAGTHPQVIGVAIIAFAACVAALRIALGWILSAVFLGIELVAIPVICVLGFAHAHSPADRLFTAHVYGPNGPISITTTAFLLGITLAFFTYQGFGNVVIFSEETRNAKKKVGRAVMWALLVAVVAMATPVAAVLLGAPSIKGLLTAPAPLTYVLKSLGGSTVDTIVSVFVFFAIVDAVVASTMCFGRVIWSSGRDLAWPTRMSRALAIVHPRLKTPYVATSALAVAAGLLTAFSTIAAIVTFIGVVTLGFAGLMALAAFVVRLRKDAPVDRYRMALWPLPPLFLVAGCIVMFTQQTVHDLLICLAVGGGFLIYYLVYLMPRSATHWVMLGAVVEEKTPTHEGRVVESVADAAAMAKEPAN
jgi:amino acid transporter